MSNKKVCENCISALSSKEKHMVYCKLDKKDVDELDYCKYFKEK
ncbi:MAG: hypothetical protein RSE41_01465 [Clostridia bacterium]